MDVNDIVRRVALAYWPLIVGLTLVGGMAGAGLHYGEKPIYTSDVRFVLDEPDSRALAEATAIADTAKSIATSPSHVEAALAVAGVQRDVGVFSARNIDLQPLGTSGVLDLTVKDTDRNAAATIANSLATDVINTRSTTSQTQANALVKSLSDQITALDASLAAVDARIAAYRSTSSDPSVNAAALSGLYSERQSLAQERLTLEQQRIQLLQSLALKPQAGIIDSAVPADQPDPSRAPIDSALGALGGLVVAVMLASVLAALRPRIEGRHQIERALEAPVLGEFDPVSEAAEAVLVARIRIAASRAGVSHIQLVPVNESPEAISVVDVLSERLGYRAPVASAPVPLNGNGQVVRPRRKQPSHEIEVTPFDPALYLKNGNANATGLVLVTPHVLARRDLESSAEAVSMTGWSVLGVITYEASQRIPRFFARQSRQAFAPMTLPRETSRSHSYHGDLR